MQKNEIQTSYKVQNKLRDLKARKAKLEVLEYLLEKVQGLENQQKVELIDFLKKEFEKI